VQTLFLLKDCTKKAAAVLLLTSQHHLLDHGVEWDLFFYQKYQEMVNEVCSFTYQFRLFFILCGDDRFNCFFAQFLGYFIDSLFEQFGRVRTFGLVLSSAD
jgi:hypothetical protein